MKSLALSDDNLSKEQEYKVVTVVKGKLPKDQENPGTKLGKELGPIGDEIDGLLNSTRHASEFDKILKDKLEEELKQYFMDVAKELIGSKISKGCILMVVVLGYLCLQLYLGEDILQFMEKIALLIYEAFKTYAWYSNMDSAKCRWMDCSCNKEYDL